MFYYCCNFIKLRAQPSKCKSQEQINSQLQLHANSTRDQKYVCCVFLFLNEVVLIPL